MPRIYRRQKEFERFLILELLEHLSYTISRPKWPERPDALVTLSKGKKKKRIAIEHTGYFNDTVAGRLSPVTRMERFWAAAQASLVSRISHRKHLTGITAMVKLTGNVPRMKAADDYRQFAKSLARELVAFVEANPVALSARLHFRRSQFSRYPILESQLSTLWLSRWTDREVLASRCSWSCCNITAGRAGLNLGKLMTYIASKNRKAKDYEHWGDADEKWLLIAAAGDHHNAHAGPPSQSVDWADPGLRGLCQGLPFDRVLFWDRTRRWYKWLKPSKPVVSYGGPR